MSSLSKTMCFHVIFFIFLWKTSCCHAHIWSQKTSVCQTYTILLVKKVNKKSPFYFDFHEKIFSLMPIWQKRPFSKKYPALMLICCQKNVHSLKNTVLSCHFFQIFMKTHIVMPIFGQTSVNSVKTTLDYGPKKSIGCPFFQFLTKNHYCHSHILSKKPPFPGKQAALMPIFSQKTLIFSKARHSHIIFL